MGYKEEVFRLYGPTVTENDSYPDAEGKGLFERFNELLGEDLDENTVKDIQELLNRMIVPRTMEKKFYSYLLSSLGFTVDLVGVDFPRLVSLLQTIFDTRGLQVCYDILFRLINIYRFDTVTREDYTVQGLDSGLGLDSGRRLDSVTNQTFYVDFYAYGAQALTPELRDSIVQIIEFNTPYYLIYVNIYYVQDGEEPELIFVNGFSSKYFTEDYVNRYYTADNITINKIFVN